MNGVEGPAGLIARLMEDKAGGPGEVEKGRTGLEKAAREFEALFLNQMLKTMRETVEESELFHGGSGEKIYTSLMDMELSKEMASSGGMGLSDVLLEYFAGTGAENVKKGGGGKIP